MASPVLDVYWFDARFDPALGRVEVYAKTEQGKTCCLVFAGIQRDVYIVPTAKQPDWAQICDDAKKAINSKLGYAQKFQVKFVERYRSVFDTKHQKERMIKLSYSARARALQQEQQEDDYVLLPGGDVSPLLLFLMNRKLKGPSWIRITTATTMPPRDQWVSDCQQEYHFTSSKHTISVLDSRPPPVWKILCVDMKTTQGRGLVCSTPPIAFDFNRDKLHEAVKKHDPDIVLRHEPWTVQSQMDLCGRSRTSSGGRLFCSTSVHAAAHVRSRTNELEELVKGALPMDSRVQLTWKFVQQCSLLDYTLQVGQLCGNLWSSILRSNYRSEQIVHTLMFEAHRRKYVLPMRQQQQQQQQEEVKQTSKKRQRKDEEEGEEEEKKDDSLRGGLVIQPKTGLHATGKWILLLDFRSLYPSIIEEYNLCFSNPDGNPDTKDLLLPDLLRDIVRARHEAPKGSVRERALKFLANSMYGCLAYTNSPFCKKSLAATVTACGRKILKASVAAVGEERVLYGHTDSLIVTTNASTLAEAESEGKKLVERINASYKVVSIRVQSFFKSLLLVSKNRLAALIWQPSTQTLEVDVRGLEVVRRDWSALTKQVSLDVLDIMLRTTETAAAAAGVLVDRIYHVLYAVAHDAPSLPVSTFVQAVALGPNWDAAPTSASLAPHVRVAHAMQQHAEAGQRVSFVICAGARELGSIGDRAVDPMHIGAEQALDLDWYLEKQVLDPVHRLCQCLPGWSRDKARVALGLDCVPRTKT